MKRILFLLISIPLIFSSCEKEEENQSNNNNNNSNTGTSGSIYGEWDVTSFIGVFTPTNGNPDEDNHQFLPNEYCKFTFINDTSEGNLIVENGYYDNSFVFVVEVDSGQYSKINDDLYNEWDVGFPLQLDHEHYVITLLTDNKLEFFVHEIMGEGTYHNTWKLEK
jgi:hypothetical protein